MRSESRPLPAGLRVLLVEDEPLIGLDIANMLSSFGVAAVAWARTMTDALSKIGSQAFDLAILDLQLGEDSSLPLAQRLEQLGVPYGLLTGYSDSSIPREFRDRPRVSKPFTGDQLLELLGKLAPVAD